MAVDTPATIAVIGAGPVGIEAALYARFLGYDVRIFERQEVVSALRQAGAAAEVIWREGVSPLGIAALSAQDPTWVPPEPTAVLSTAEWVKRYFLPLAQSDLLVDGIAIDSEVIGIERDLAPGEIVEEDEVSGFRLRIRSASGESVETADVVIDASGSTEDTGRLTFGDLDRDNSAAVSADDHSPQRLVTAEADFYILGAKSASTPAQYRFVDGLAQIRDLFTIIADRPTLDLYARIAASS